jgi:hypothetical protein
MTPPSATRSRSTRSSTAVAQQPTSGNKIIPALERLSRNLNARAGVVNLRSRSIRK